MEIDGLRVLAAQHNVNVSEIFAVVSKALNEAQSAGAGVRIELDPNSGKLSSFDENDNPLGEPKLDRAAANTVRQAVISWVRDLERRKVVGVWANRGGNVIEVTVLGPGRGDEVRVIADDTAGVIPAGEQIKEETLNKGDKVHMLLLAANVDARGKTKLTFSRRQPALVQKMIEKTSPEVANGKVLIKSIAREPGVRTKIALQATDKNTDAIVSVVGAGGYRMREVLSVLGTEKVDLVLYSEDIAQYVLNALTPAKVTSATVTNDMKREVKALVPVDQMGLATGAKGINVSLAKRLTKAKITLTPHG